MEGGRKGRRREAIQTEIVASEEILKIKGTLV